MNKTLQLPKKDKPMDAVQRALAAQAALEVEKMAGVIPMVDDGSPDALRRIPGNFDAAPVVIEQPFVREIGGAYLVSKGFTTSSPVTMVFKQGQVLRDPTMIRRLLDGGAPLVEIEDLSVLQTCPNCKHVFCKE